MGQDLTVTPPSHRHSHLSKQHHEVTFKPLNMDEFLLILYVLYRGKEFLRKS